MLKLRLISASTVNLCHKTVQNGIRCLCTRPPDGSTRGGHTDRTRLEDDIYDESPELEAQQQYEDQKDQEAADEAAIKSRILSAALRFVPQHGWSKKAIIAGTQAEDLPPITHGLISKGPIELVHHFYSSANEDLARRLSVEIEEVERGTQAKKKVNLFIKDAVTYRLNLLIPYIDSWPQAMGLMALPQNIPDSLQHLSHLVDDIWYHAGDRSVDFNWYTKRVTLAVAYKATELYLLQDKSDGYEDTWVYLDRRLRDLSRIGNGIRQIQDSTNPLGDLFLGTCIMVRNVVGMSDRHR